MMMLFQQDLGWVRAEALLKIPAGADFARASYLANLMFPRSRAGRQGDVPTPPFEVLSSIGFGSMIYGTALIHGRFVTTYHG